MDTRKKEVLSRNPVLQGFYFAYYNDYRMVVLLWE